VPRESSADLGRERGTRASVGRTGEIKPEPRNAGGVAILHAGLMLPIRHKHHGPVGPEMAKSHHLAKCPFPPLFTHEHNAFIGDEH
jgi:hypothetical protein